MQLATTGAGLAPPPHVLSWMVFLYVCDGAAALLLNHFYGPSIFIFRPSLALSPARSVPPSPALEPPHVMPPQDLFDALPKLADLKVTYGALDSGMQFEFRMYGMRQQDCRQFANVLRRKSTLTALSLPENQIDSDKLKALITGLVKNYSITVLDLSHNKIEDAGAQVSVPRLGPGFARQGHAQAIGS